MRSKKTYQSGAPSKSCKGCGSLHDGSFATGKYCSKVCSLQNRNQLAKEKAYKKALQNQPPHTLRVERVERHDKKKGFQYRYIFLCQECKKQEVWHPVYYFSNPTKYGHLTTFRCRRCSNTHNWDKKRKPHESTFNVLVAAARERGVEVSLTLDDFCAFTHSSHCHYCGADVHWAERRSHRKPKGHNLDRKDNSKGYSIENCVVCCFECNRIKSDWFSYEEMRVLGEVIKKFPRRLRKTGNRGKSV